MADLVWVVIGWALGYCVVSRRGWSFGWRVAAALAWVVLLAVLLVYTFIGAVWAGSGAVIGVAVGFVAAVVFEVGALVFRCVGNAGRRSGLFDWVVQNRRQAAGVGAALLVVVGAGVLVFANWPVGENGAVVVSVLPVSRKIDGCPCGGVDLCEGPRGGRYCLTDAGAKRYK